MSIHETRKSPVVVAGVWMLLVLLSAASARAQGPVIAAILDAGLQPATVAAPGSVLQVFGERLAVAGTFCHPTTTPYPTEDTQCGLTGEINGQAVAIGSVIENQATLYLPWDLEPDPAELILTVAGVGKSAPYEITIQKYSPVLLALEGADGRSIEPHRRKGRGNGKRVRNRAR